MFFLDTNVCICFLKGTFPSIREHLLQVPPHQVKIPVVVQAELLYGAYKSVKKEGNLGKVRAFLSPFEIVDLRSDMAELYAQIRVDTESRGQSVGSNDLLIATITMAHHGVLVTRNTREFGRIEGLAIAEW